MARINRSDVIQKAVDDLAFSASEDKIPNETLDKVQLVYSLNKQFSNIVRSSTVATTQSSLTLYSVGASEDFYLTSIQLSNMSDATADNTTINISGTVDGASRVLATLRKLTTTAFNDSIFLSFNYPIKIDKGTNITLANAFTVGASTTGVSIAGIKLSSY